MRHIGKFSYELEFPNFLESVHPVFHVSLLIIFLRYPTSIVHLEGFGVKEFFSYKEVEIFNKQVQKLRNKKVPSVIDL